MIKYSLQCDNDHAFEAWFASGEAYTKQRKRGLVHCPDCASKKISKALMAPNVGVRQNKQPDKQSPAQARQAPVERVANKLDEKQQMLLDLMREVRRQVETNAEYVGPNFAEEARKIHHDEAPARGIYGEATIEEARVLAEEGIEAYPLPVLPEDKN